MTNESSQTNYQSKLLVKRYQLQEKVGVGAMGKVYKAKDTTSKGLNVAVKILARALDDMKMIERFQREATISALLSERSINIVKVKDYGVDENKVPFYVMELLEGENLDDFIEYHDLSLLQFLALARQICSAMDTAHNGIFFEGEICPIIHRDLKPSNIFIIEDKDKGELIIKVLDFGIAKLLHTENEEEDAFAGTPKYCSPEQIKGEELDNRSDIYSLGIVLYQMLEKRLPWDLEDNSMGAWYKAHTEMIPDGFSGGSDVPVELQRLIMRCLSKSPNDRPQSVGEIIQAIDSLKRKIQPKPYIRENIQTIDLEQKKTAEKKQNLSPLEQIYFDSSWPKNKPQQKIVFPRIIPLEDKLFPSLWVMLEEEDIKKRESNIRYNKFLFQSYPHPMILWITVLYSMEDGPRWLPCYLDLQTKIGQDVINVISDQKKYHILLFALNKPEKCQHILNLKVMLKQRTQLKQWASVGKMLNLKDKNRAVVTKRKLKDDFETLKPEIILEIQKSHTQEIHA